MTTTAVPLVAALLTAGVPLDAAATTVWPPNSAAGRRAEAALAAGSTLSQTLHAAEPLSDDLLAATAALDNHPTPGPLLARVSHWSGHANRCRDKVRHLNTSWLALAGSVAVFTAAAGLAAAATSTLNVWATAALWAGVIIPVVAFVVLRYLNILGRRPRLSASAPVRQYADATWADLLAAGLRAGDDYDTAAAQAHTITGALWPADSPDTPDSSLEHAVALGTWTDQTADIAHAWADAAAKDADQHLAHLTSGAVVAGVTVLSALLSTYTLLIALPAIA